MAELKTKETKASVEDFINKVIDEEKRQDCFTIIKMMKAATKSEAKLWGTAIIGFGDVVLKYESGRVLDWFRIGFSPRKQNIALYISGVVKNEDPLLQKLGKYKTGKGCLYINKLKEVDVKVLNELIKKSLK
jgi:hypothetical protein